MQGARQFEHATNRRSGAAAGPRRTRASAPARSLALAGLLALGLGLGAGPARATAEDDPAAHPAEGAALPAGSTLLADLAYGPAPQQRYDVYLPPSGLLPSTPAEQLGLGRIASEASANEAAPGRPLVLMVHGGDWQRGDKADALTVGHKAAHWLARGAVFVSTNYRVLPQARPAEQALDVAAALAAVQARAPEWGVDPARVVLVGHAAGAHLVALLSADPVPAYDRGAKRWLGSVLLDTVVLDIAAQVEGDRGPHLREVFGDTPADWEAASPMQRLGPHAVPMLLVCSSTRANDDCEPARVFARSAATFDAQASVLPTPRSHRQINEELGAPGDYTRAVDVFLGRLDGAFLPHRR